MRNYFTDIKNKTPQAIAPTLIAAIIFLIMYFCFGAGNSMIGPFATLAYLSFRNMRDNLGCMVRNFAIFIVMACAAYAATQNLALCITVNATALFWIAYLLINEYQPSNYFPAGMALIFFQISPAGTPRDLMVRIMALLVSFAIIFLFVWISSKINKKREPLIELISRGFAVCRQMLSEAEQAVPLDSQNADGNDALRDGNAKYDSEQIYDELHSELRGISHDIAMEIYSYNRSSLSRKGAVNWFCQFLLFFQCFDFLMHKKASSSLTQEVSPMAQGSSPMDQARHLYDKFDRIFRSGTPMPDFRKLNIRSNRPDLRSFRFRFALRMVIVMTPVLAFCSLSGLENVYWLAISVFFMMIPFSSETNRRVKERVTGSVIGIILCFALFTIFPGLTAHIIIMIIANFFIYTAGSYTATVAYITCSALAIQTVDAFVPVALGERLAYTLIGALIAILANRLIFPIRPARQIEYLKEILADIRHMLTGLNDDSESAEIIVSFGRRKKTGKPLDKACLVHQTDQLLIKSYLISGRIAQLNDSMPEQSRDPDLPRLEQEHMGFMADYLVKYL